MEFPSFVCAFKKLLNLGFVDNLLPVSFCSLAVQKREKSMNVMADIISLDQNPTCQHGASTPQNTGRLTNVLFTFL